MSFLVDQFGEQKRWVNYRIETRENKQTKLPYQTNGKLASSTDPETWATYDQVDEVSEQVGIVFLPDQLLLGIDIDKCLKDNQIVHEEKEKIADLIIAADTYTEISPSQTGLHLFLKLTTPFVLERNKKAPYELYTTGRYFTVTNDYYKEDKPVREVTVQEAKDLLAIIDYPWKKDTEEEDVSGAIHQGTQSVASLEDSEILEKMFKASNGKEIRKLYNGDITAYKNDESVADMALLSHLAFWTDKNASQMERLWVASPMADRPKVQNRLDYRTRSVKKAIEFCKETYTPPVPTVEEIEEDEEKQILKEFLKEKIKSTYHLADYLTRQFNIVTIGEKEREMYVYRDGVYFQAENEIIYPEIQRILGEHTTKHAKTETFHKIADMTSRPRTIFSGTSPEFIPLHNGVYNFKTKELLPHSSDYHFTYKFPITYRQEATCPKTLAFFKQVLTDEQLPTFQEWLGYYFYRSYLFKKAIIFVGEGDTGKTTLLEVITYLLGRKNISSVSLQKMTSDRFSAAHLYEKHGNLVDELSAKDIADTGNFKIATGGGSISGEYKYGNQFSFLNFSKFTFACNKIPDVKDFDDVAYFGRWMVMRFEKIIEKKIPDFISTLTAEEERSGLFNWAMEGLERLLAQDGFSYAKTAMETKVEMMRAGSSIAMFASEGVVNEPEVEISKADMYDAYSRFCAHRGLATETMDMFGKKFLFYISYAIEGLIYDTTSKSGKRVRGWRNVGLVKSSSLQESSDKVEEVFQAI